VGDGRDDAHQGESSSRCAPWIGASRGARQFLVAHEKLGEKIGQVTVPATGSVTAGFTCGG
jgi:hypothetical protein